MSPPTDARVATSASGKSGPNAGSFLILEFARGEPPRPSPPRPGSIREAIARWLEQPL